MCSRCEVRARTQGVRATVVSKRARVVRGGSVRRAARQRFASLSGLLMAMLLARGKAALPAASLQAASAPQGLGLRALSVVSDRKPPRLQWCHDIHERNLCLWQPRAAHGHDDPPIPAAAAKRIDSVLKLPMRARSVRSRAPSCGWCPCASSRRPEWQRGTSQRAVDGPNAQAIANATWPRPGPMTRVLHWKGPRPCDAFVIRGTAPKFAAHL